MAGLPWYKHYTDAHQSDKLTKILSEFGLKGYGQYWILLEHMGKKFTGKERSFTFETRNLKSILHISHNKLFVNYMEFLTKIGLISYKIQGKSTIVKTPILFILQGKDNKYDKNKRGKCVGKTDPKIEDIRLKKEKERERKTSASRRYF